MDNNQTTKVICYLVQIKDDTYMFNTEVESRHFFRLKKLEGAKPILSALTETTTVILTKRVLAC